ncbi:hypothetical protein GH714_009038 [Hevea brasiliensis]|uniref:diacylglycerol kinase (ATP) n=1 Tax=Hevea brasiliensis TaxID=3981 RepID=A0A6A6KAM7_HEVBR|nr:hypothetical protein GH714_009038 [Hevea brasiliensis]
MDFRNSFSPRSGRLKDLKDSFRHLVSRSHDAATAGVKSESVLKDFYIPDYILVAGSEPEVYNEEFHSPSCPVIVFINSKSGGQLGGELLVTYRSLLNQNQVIDLGEKAPDKVLHQIYATLQTLKNNGDELATEIEKRLRIIVAGGDGTAGWLLGVVCDLKLPQPPPIATVPLGTGNNLPFSFGWGKKNPGTDSLSVESFLEQVRAAKEMKIDSWHIIMRMKCPKEGSCDPVAPLELPHSLHAFHRVSESDSLNMRDFTPPYVDDGLIEVVGFRNAWHGLVLLAPSGHGTRLAQASRIRFEFCKGAAVHTFMRIDGEPWKQPLPADDDTVVVEISYHNQVTMLATTSCPSRSIHDPASPINGNDDEEDNTDEEDESAEDWEERRKFGAADTFKFPDEFDISQLS